MGIKGRKTIENGGEAVKARACENLGRAELILNFKASDYNDDTEYACERIHTKLIPIVEGAGGVITDWKGGKLCWDPNNPYFDPEWGFKVVAVGDRAIHQSILEKLS